MVAAAPTLDAMAQRRPEWMFRFAAWVVIAFVRLMRWRLDIRGSENLPREGGAVITFNHHSYADFFMCAWSVYRERGRAVRFLAKEELFGLPVVGWILRGARQVPVARGSRSGRKEAFAVAVQRLQEGELIAVAPEQTISQSFELLPFSTGAVRMAQDAGVPIIPSVNWGTHRWATKNRPIDWRAVGIPVLVHYGEPMVIAPDEDVTEATRRVRQRMEVMLAELQQRYPEQPEPGEDWWLPERLGGSAPSHDEVLRAHRERERGWRSRAADQELRDRDAG